MTQVWGMQKIGDTTLFDLTGTAVIKWDQRYFRIAKKNFIRPKDTIAKFRISAHIL